MIESVKKLLHRKKKESEQRHDIAIYIHMLFRLISADTAREIREAIAEIMPEAVVTGMTETLYVNEDLESMLRMNITFLQSSKVHLLEYLGPPECYEEAGRTLGEKISHMSLVKAVGIYSAGLSTNFHKFVSSVACGNEEVPFYGATAGMFEFSADDSARFSNLICNYGTSEIYCHHGKGGILNSALVAVGMREGEAWLKVCADTSTHRGHDVIPLSERMAAFLDAVTEELRESNRELKSMAEAAEAASRAREEYMAAGFDDYLSKPIDSQHLEAALQKYLPRGKVQIAETPLQEERSSPLPDWEKLKEILG